MGNTITITNAGRAVWALVFLEDSKHLLSGGREEIIRQWRVEDGREVEDQRLLAKGHSQVTAIALSEDGNWVISGGWEVVAVWNRATRQIAFMSRAHSSWVNAVHVSPDSKKFATASSDWTVRVWDMEAWRPLLELQHGNNVMSAKFSPDGNRIATAMRDGELQIFNAHDGQLIRNIPVTLSLTDVVTWSSIQHIFALTSKNVVRCIHADTGAFLAQWKIPGQLRSDNHGSIALSHNGKFIASFVGGSLTMWDVNTRTQFGPIFEHPQAPKLYTTALSPDNNYVATGGWGGVITIRNLGDIIPTSHLVIQPPPARPPPILVTPQRISAGTYHIKSATDELYLQEDDGVVVVQPFDETSGYQRWSISVSDDAYNIKGSTGLLLTIGDQDALVTSQSGTAWTFDARGNAYVIGNVENAMAIQQELDGNLSVSLRNNRLEQRWVLEHAT